METLVNQPSFYAVIPAHIRYCKELEGNAKLLYGELTALSSMYGYCWATNEYFANLYGVDVRTIQNWLESLKKLGFISVQLEKQGMKTLRKIWISNEFKEMFATRKEFHGRHEKNVMVDMKEISPIVLQDNSNTKTDDDDARENADLKAIIEQEKSIPEKITYRNPSGHEQSVSKNEIFRRFIRKPFKTDTLITAIKRLIERKDLIGNVFKYLETICAQIESNDHPIQKTERKSKKTIENSIPMPKEGQEFAPAVSWEEVEKKRKAQKGDIK